MATVIMPKMGDAMEEGTLLKWLKQAGDEVSEGDPIAEIETDKVTLEIDSPEGGFITSVLVDEGETVPIGTAVAMIGAESEVGSAPAPQEPEAVATTTDEASAPAAQQQSTPAEAPAAPEQPPAAPSPAAQSQVVAREPGERVRASPLVKRLAQEHGLDLTQVGGSGPGGRIIKNDIADYVSGAKPLPQAAAVEGVTPAAASEAPSTATSAPSGTKLELSRIKRTTGKRMAESKSEIPHYYVSINVEMSEALTFRKQVNTALEAEGGRISVNDLVVKAAALALRDHPNVNTSFVDGELYQQESIDINIAIAVGGGLIAPFIPQADQKSLGTIGSMARDLGTRAREGGLTMDEYQGGTFTISNLGMFDVDEFVAVINPPQAAILAVGSVQQVPVVQDGEIEAGNVMKLTLSADHRALDGAEVATFLQDVKKYLQNPTLLSVA